MTQTITIDEVEYNTEDFTDEQKGLVNELVFNSNLQTQLDYQSSSLKHTQQALTEKLKDSIAEVDRNK